MTERFELQINGNGQVDIIDWVESKEKNAICIYNDLGVIPFSSAKALCELLNQLYDENLQFKEILSEIVRCAVYDKKQPSLSITLSINPKNYELIREIMFFD